MREIWLCLLLLSDFCMVNISSLRLVRLVDHRSYVISVIQKTMSRVEQRQWCNLKIDDMSTDISETVLGTPIAATIELKNGFVLSLQKIDIKDSTIQQVWLTRSNTSVVNVQATVRMLNVAIGFDVTTNMREQVSHSTGVILYPELQFPFTITKDLFTDDITVVVTGAPIRTTNLMEFLPENDVTKVFTVLFDWNSTASNIDAWATDIFAPITYQLVTKEVDFPTICYDCPT